MYDQLSHITIMMFGGGVFSSQCGKLVGKKKALNPTSVSWSYNMFDSDFGGKNYYVLYQDTLVWYTEFSDVKRLWCEREPDHTMYLKLNG
jgi:hypothetical protein